jgi:uncharacterized caspase-like protein
MRRPHRPVWRLTRLLFFTVVCSLFALVSCSFEITAARYALVYGAKDYPGTAQDLSYTDADASDMRDALTTAGWEVRSAIPDGTVTKSQILTDIASLIGEVDPDSSVLVYFSGHGTEYLGTTYILPTDAITFTPPNIYSSNFSSFISPSELWAALDALPCRNRILILDTCYSGGFVTDTGTLDAAPQNYGVYDDGTGGSALLAALGSYSDLLASAFDSYDPATPMVVTAAGSEELSYESGTYGNGVFTHFFLEAASKGDLDGNGFVTIQEAYRYARERVDSYWNSTYYSYFESGTGTYADYLPRISGNARDVVIF